MTDTPRRRTLIIVILAILLLLLLWLVRCSRPKEIAASPSPVAPAQTPPTAPPATAAPATKGPEEVLTPATLQAPPQVVAGTVFQVQWTGPANLSDYITIVRQDAAAGTYANYRETREGNPLPLTAPIEPGEWELRYMAARSRTVLGRAPVTVTPIAAALTAPGEAVQGVPLQITWTGPDNEGDYITVVTRDTPDGQYGNYTYTKQGSPLTLTMPMASGDAELRYMTGQGGKVLGRRPVRIVAAGVTLSAPAEAIAGSTVSVAWTGPDNASDYITLVPATTPDGQYRNYTDTKKGSPLTVTAPIEPGEVEVRYMSGQGAKVLARRSMKIVAADITVDAPAEVTAGSTVSVTWTGPNNPGDYFTVVPKATPDNQYGNYTYTTKGSPLTVAAPKATGEAEVRYVSGQGSKVLVRRPIRIVP